MARLRATYPSAAALARHLHEHASQGAFMLPLSAEAELPRDLQQFTALELEVAVEDSGQEVTTPAEVLQVMPGVGVAVRLPAPFDVIELVGGAQVEEDAPPPTVTNPERRQPARERGPRGPGPMSWPLERVQAEWGNLQTPDKIKLAKHGKRPVRGMIIRGNDKLLHGFVLSNPHVSADEIAALASKVNLDPQLLKRIANSQDWTRHTQVARALICHPKTTLQQVSRLVDRLPDDELRRLTRGGKVRASVKRIIIKRLEYRSGRR